MRLVRLYDPRPIFMNSQCCVSFQCLLIRRCQGSRQLLRVEARGGPEAKRWRCSAGPSTGYLFDSDSLSILGRTHGRSWKGTCPQSSVLFLSAPKARVFLKLFRYQVVLRPPVLLNCAFLLPSPSHKRPVSCSRASSCLAARLSQSLLEESKIIKNPYTTLAPT